MRNQADDTEAVEPHTPQQQPKLRLLSDMAELTECEAIQREVWGLADIDIVPASQLRAATHAGGHVVGAYVADELAGFAYAFVATPHGRGMAGVGLHSHMVAVRARRRGHGLGRRLKWFQRSLALEQGLNWMTWTFDPLQAANANLNLRHLGAVCKDYLVDFYGAMPGPLGGGQESDRLLALWLLHDAGVIGRAEAFAAGGEPDTVRVRAAAVKEVWLLTSEDVVDPATVDAHALLARTTERARLALAEMLALKPRDRAETIARIAAPADVTSLLRRDPGLANRWRLGVRAAMMESLNAGLTVTGFENGAYALRQLGK